MVDHDERQILQKIEDDALAEARRRAQEVAQEEVKPEQDDTGEEQAGVESDEEGLTSE